ncbi:bifunctional 4-hydroxy-2-oxoglutarate aldolase/2-dehydro-3-deoxy-phosphogluconate aldolase [Microbacterium sp. ET2]|uniref:bifunctional 4-hydroxy-2-oxoglutarate aldolase/2-dehydro-3-deoxy-phosphogluconate aldolase n=1 Tax=Microbacterium albipurpureum TaxID=3050384 RepID=UPI00259CA146|nr:bifunctional 4-hydroxy-2-oxoglutarate aldolase/2-dehydro-3-deoxy-phosphogluconate aldolase [Microbacterium sp. ET2 (Ac-2212)]WJL96918.1 bifunctional 4-hydroxy-2-oxoglutarate aldolase/2-dehydro-3-deoxy-phosphogluconate aldolase [Microbacterium sp. ET2 (Ac-2212)]
MTPASSADAYFASALTGQPIMGVFRNLAPAHAVARATRAWDAGVRNVEIPVQSRDAMPTLRAVIDAARERGLDVGAGTVVSPEQLVEVQQAGAAYTVSPGLDPDVVRASAERSLPHLPGVATASEILAARRLGLHWVKAFPASVLGAAWIRAMRGPFPDQRFVVTGGMTIRVAQDFLDAGVSTVAIGDDFDDHESLAAVTALMARG